MSPGGSSCTGGNSFNRDYALNLVTSSTVVASFLTTTLSPDAESWACIAVDGMICGFNLFERGSRSGSTTSAACVLNLSAGNHTIQFSTIASPNQYIYRGSLAIWPL